MMRRIDAITAYGRWLALIPVLIAALVIPRSELLRGFWPLVIAVLSMAIVDMIPVVMLQVDFYP